MKVLPITKLLFIKHKHEDKVQNYEIWINLLRLKLRIIYYFYIRLFESSAQLSIIIILIRFLFHKFLFRVYIVYVCLSAINYYLIKRIMKKVINQLKRMVKIAHTIN